MGEKRRFTSPVAIELIPGDPMLLGFVTRESVSQFGLDAMVAVYVPQSYALAGHTLLVPRSHIRPLVAESADVMSVVSGGVTETR